MEVYLFMLYNKFILKTSLELIRPLNLVGYLAGGITYYVLSCAKQFSKVPNNGISMYQILIPVTVGAGASFWIRKKVKGLKKVEPVQQKQENNFDYNSYNQTPDHEPLRQVNGGFTSTKEKGCEEITTIGNTVTRRYEFERMVKQ